MSNFQHIQTKLRQFTKKYYANQLIKGMILFFSLGMLYFLFTLFIEHFLWLEPRARTALFWLFVLVEIGLFIWLIANPTLRLFQLKKGINTSQAARIIGNHFPEVNDKLLNVLQLQGESEKTDLLLASIEQKSAALRPIPFRSAINLEKNVKYAKYALIPLGVVALVWLSGNVSLFSDSYKRVVNYNTAYEPPAPFSFVVMNPELTSLEGVPITLNVRTSGKVIPEEAQIHFNNESYFLKHEGVGGFSFEMPTLKERTTFFLSANGVSSGRYAIEVIAVPKTTQFYMSLDYPGYVGRQDEVVTNTGNATIPEGTEVTWKLSTQNTDEIVLYARDTLRFTENARQFTLSKRIYENLEYKVSASNALLTDYEQLGYRLQVIKDQRPEIKVKAKRDSSEIETLLFQGQVSDDYAVSKLQLHYYPVGDENNKKTISIPTRQQGFDLFYYAFPNGLDIQAGTAYEMYFAVTDNDALRNGKTTKSQVFQYRMKTAEELQEDRFEEQRESIEGFNKAVEKLEDQQERLKELSKTQKEREQFNFDEQQKLKDFFKRQQEQEQLMQKFTEQLQENLQKTADPQDEEFKKLLEERLERQNKEFEKNEKLLEALEKMAEKLDKEELAKKLEEMGKRQANDKRNLQQLLELTKKYYVAERTQKIATQLKELAKRQTKASEAPSKENTSEQQRQLNEEFEKRLKELEELAKENDQLRNPMKLPKEKKAKQEIQQQQQSATKQLEQKEQSNDANQQQESNKGAQKSQQRAGKMMQKLGERMEETLMMGGGQSQEMEDAEMLRQILDNLLEFSLEQEALMEDFNDISDDSPNFARSLKKQNNLRQVFEHVDDSLFALSLRRPEIGAFVNEEITDVYFNIDKSLERFSNNLIYQGIGNQQYALTASNNLASMLSDVLDRMQQSMSASSGGGQGQQGFQLPDIIKSQEELNGQMQQGMQQGEQKEGQEQQDEEGRPNQPGEDGKEKQSGLGNEQRSEQLFEIYKQQQQLRQALERQLKNIKGAGNKSNTDRLLRDMERVERELLEKGFNQQTLSKMLQLKHELLKLDKATFQQGKKKERESTTNEKEHQRNTISPSAIKEYFKQTEILNRQALPLRQQYKERTQRYFKGEQ